MVEKQKDAPRHILSDSGAAVFDEVSRFLSVDNIKELYFAKSEQLSDKDVLLFFSREQFSEVELRQLKTMSHVAISHVHKTELHLSEQLNRLVLEQSLEDLKAAQRKLVNQSDLEKSKARYKALIQATSTIVWRANERGEFIEHQFEWEKYTGQGFDRHKGFGWADALHPSCRDKCVSEWRRVLETGENLLTKGQLWSAKHQSYRYFEVFAAPIRDSWGKIIEWIGNITDTTDRLYQKAKLEETVDELKEAVEVRSKFLANVSHEIRTPLNSIIGFSDIALEEENSKILKDYLKTINQTSESLLSLLNDVLDFSKLESNMKLTETSFILEDLVNDIFKSVSLQVDPDLVEVKMIDGNHEKRKVFLDESKLKQIILNLVFNSVKFTSEGFISIEHITT